MVHWSWLIVAFLIGWCVRPEKKEKKKYKYIK